MNPLDIIKGLQLLFPTVHRDFLGPMDVEKPYGELYQITFNQNEADISILTDIVEERKNIKTVLECFSGNGYESLMLKEECEHLEVTAGDIDIDYFDKIEGIKYVQMDCYPTNPIKYGEGFDMIFVGISNGSLCVITTLQDLINHFKFVKENLNPKGVYVASYLDQTITDHCVTKLREEYYPIRFIDKYKDHYCRWQLFIKKESSGLFTYYNYAVVYDPKGAIVKRAFSNIVVRSWPSSLIESVAKEYGGLIPLYEEEINSEYRVFIKR